MERHERSAIGQQGFTLIELLVAVSIVGLLAALAIPSFLQAHGQAGDAAAKSILAEAHTDAEMLALDGGGSYLGVKKAGLHRDDPSLIITKTGGAYLSSASGTADTYTLTAISGETGDKFTLERRADGTIARTCKIAARTRPHGGCEDVAGVNGSW
jgi:prepilin-type N-terminal cleavage/methylation domain-containing protein